MHRRAFLTASFAALASPALAADSASRTFRILRDGDDIGTHRLDAVQTGNGFEVDITIRIAVKVLGITAYRYELDNREVWKGGQLISLNSKVNDDGTEEFARAVRNGDMLDITGSRFSGKAPGAVATTSYYAKPFLQRAPWISTQSGDLLDIKISAGRGPNWYRVSGGLDTNLLYDANGEWVGCEFDAGGEPAAYETIASKGGIAALWSAA